MKLDIHISKFSILKKKKIYIYIYISNFIDMKWYTTWAPWTRLLSGHRIRQKTTRYAAVVKENYEYYLHEYTSLISLSSLFLRWFVYDILRICTFFIAIASSFCLGFIWSRDRKFFIFPHMSLIGGEKVEELKKIYLVEKKNKMIEKKYLFKFTFILLLYNTHTHARTHTHTYIYKISL